MLNKMKNKKIILGLILSALIVLSLVGMIHSHKLEKETIAKFKEINPLIDEDLIKSLKQAHPDISDEEIIERLIDGIETVKSFNPEGISDEEIIERIEIAIVRINRINEQNLGWTAGLTGVSLLSYAEMKGLCGIRKPTEKELREMEELIKEKI